MSIPSELVRARARARPGLLRRLWLDLRFRDAVLITVVPLGMIALLFANAVLDYYRASQFDDWFGREASVARAFSSRVRAVLTLPERLVLRQRLNQDAPDAGIIRLDVPGRAWDSLHGDPQRMWGEWVEGELRYGSTMVPIRVRKRGDNSVHWLTDKRTMTVRTTRAELYKRYRTFGLSAKDVVPAWLVNRLAWEFDLLAPATEVVPVFLNNRFYGVFRFVEVVDESFLRAADRMPGNIYRGDRAERGDYLKGVPRGLFENPYLWDRVAENDRWTAAGADQIDLLVRDLQGGTFADHLRMMERVDRREMSRLFAYLLLMGDPYHMSGVHNQLVYEDPSTQRLHPIVWDVRLLDLARPGPQAVNRWFRALLADPFVVDQTIREVVARLADGRVLAAADSLVRALEARYPPHLAYDRLREGTIPPVGLGDEALTQLRANARLLGRWTDSSVVAFHAARGSGGLVVVDLESRGFAGANLDSLKLDGPVPGPVVLRLDRNGNGVPDPGDSVVVLGRRPAGSSMWLVPPRPIALYPAWDTGGSGLGPGRMPYRLFLSGAPEGGQIEAVMSNRATGGPVRVVPWEAGATVAAPTGWHPWRYPDRRPRAHRLDGTRRLAETLRIPPGDTLLIAPGTTLVLDPEVSIVSRGLVLARGTEARPIRVLSADPARPWGTFALQGHGADRSVIEHAAFVGGGGALVDRIEYIGMVNVHRADSVRFEHVRFEANLRSDDTFHALHARDVVLRNSRFVRANSDAVDFDLSSGLIADNTFAGAGGDAIDLMGSSPLIVGNRIVGAGDKGISIGEASHPVVFANSIEGSVRGVEVKDRSAPLLLHNELVDNGVGLGQELKNWRYGDGGWATVVNTVFHRNRIRRESDSVSRLTLAGVQGLDSVDTPSAGDLWWLYGALGLRVTDPRPGLPRRWDWVTPTPPLIGGTFEDDFGDVADGWRPSGGTTRLEKRRGALIMEVERVPGRATIEAPWEIGDNGGTIVLEASARDLLQVDVVAVTDLGTVRQRFDPGGDLTTFQWLALDLGPGRYRGLAVVAEPRPGLSRIQRTTGLSVLTAGRLEIRRWGVYARPLPETAR